MNKINDHDDAFIICVLTLHVFPFLIKIVYYNTHTFHTRINRESKYQ